MWEVQILFNEEWGSKEIGLSMIGALMALWYWRARLSWPVRVYQNIQ